MKLRTALGAGMVVLLVAALPAAAQAGVLYSTLEAPNDVQGPNAEYAENTQRLAQAFTPATAGTARVVSLFGQTITGSGTGTVQVSIHADAAGHPGTLLATGSGTIDETTGASPTCTVLNATPALSTGQTYWAVLRGVNKGANWLFSRQQARQVLRSANAGATWAQGGIQKTFSLRVEDTAACGPTSPESGAGATLGDMYAKPGGTSFQTIFAGERGNQTLTLTGASFSGPTPGRSAPRGERRSGDQPYTSRARSARARPAARSSTSWATVRCPTACARRRSRYVQRSRRRRSPGPWSASSTPRRRRSSSRRTRRAAQLAHRRTGQPAGAGVDPSRAAR